MGEARRRGTQGQIMPGLVAMVTSLDFILIATGSHRKVYKQGYDHYDLLLRKITQTAVWIKEAQAAVRKLQRPGP